MNNLKVYVKNNVKLEPKTHVEDVGIDVRTTSLPEIVGKRLRGTGDDGNKWVDIEYIEYETNISIDTIQRNNEQQIFTLMPARSSVSKKNLILANGVGIIDPNFRGNLKVRFKYHMQPQDLRFSPENEQFYLELDESRIYKLNDLIAQLIFAEVIDPEIVYVPELAATSRGNGGFGSTTKKD